MKRTDVGAATRSEEPRTVEQRLAARAVDIAAELFLVDPGHVRSRTRMLNATRARFVAMLLCREMGYSYPLIGELFERDHTTAMNGVATARGMFAGRPFTRKVLERMIDELRGDREVMRLQVEHELEQGERDPLKLLDRFIDETTVIGNDLALAIEQLVAERGELRAKVARVEAVVQRGLPFPDVHLDAAASVALEAVREALAEKPSSTALVKALVAKEEVESAACPECSGRGLYGGDMTCPHCGGSGRREGSPADSQSHGATSGSRLERSDAGRQGSDGDWACRKALQQQQPESRPAGAIRCFLCGAGAANMPKPEDGYSANVCDRCAEGRSVDEVETAIGAMRARLLGTSVVTVVKHEQRTALGPDLPDRVREAELAVIAMAREVLKDPGAPWWLAALQNRVEVLDALNKKPDG